MTADMVCERFCFLKCITKLLLIPELKKIVRRLTSSTFILCDIAQINWERIGDNHTINRL